MNLNVLTYNIRHGKGMDGIFDINRTIEVLRESGADVIGMQEVDCGFGERSAWLDQTAVMAEALGMYAAFGGNYVLEEAPGYTGAPRQMGNAILSRYPIAFSRNHRLPQVLDPEGWNEVRGVLEAHLDTGGGSVRFFCTHLGLSQKERAVQRVELMKIVAASEGESAPTILAGDFNARPESPEMEAIRKELTSAYAEAHEGRHSATFIDADPQPCIDYIYCSSDFRVNGAEIIRTEASDHYPLAAGLTLVAR